MQSQQPIYNTPDEQEKGLNDFAFTEQWHGLLIRLRVLNVFCLFLKQEVLQKSKKNCFYNVPH